MEAGDCISVIAIVFSIISFVLAFRLSLLSEKASMRPVLVFVYIEGSGWHLRNIGKGPALNIIIAKKYATGDWFDPVRVPPLSEDGDLDLAWWGLANIPEAGTTYEDFQGRVYSSTCKNDLSRVFQKRVLPSWDESRIKRHWRYAQESQRSSLEDQTG